jgi:hypothetical protein
MAASASLNTGFLIGGDDKFVIAEGLSVPETMVKIQDRYGFDQKIWISWKDPTPMLPGTYGIGMKPTPNRGIANGGDQTGLSDLRGQIRQTPAREREVMSSGKFASQSLNLNDQFWGEKPGGGPVAIVPPNRRVVLQRSVFATC